VIYYDRDDPKHAGVVRTGTMRVRSKWGGNELFEHPLMHVPAPYGDKVRYFDEPDGQTQEILARLTTATQDNVESLKVTDRI
jgi:hypothetical protein